MILRDKEAASEGESGETLEARIQRVGASLANALETLIAAVAPGNPGPVEVARALAVDKVLASRVLKAARNKDPVAVVYLVPGPEPLRRLIRAAGRRGAATTDVQQATAAVDDLERLIRHEAGDRSALDAIVSAWLPEARAEFELRRKQAAFRAMSQLKGAAADLNLATVILHPADNGTHLDVVWLFGLLGLQRLRPGSPVKFSSRRVNPESAPRRPRTLDGDPVEGLDGLRLESFCSQPPSQLDVQRAGDVVHYLLAPGAYGRKSATDLVFAEVNLEEIRRFVPRGSGRKGYYFAETATPVKLLIFDVLVHDDVYPGREPGLVIYDTVLDGIASVNDPSRDVDRMELAESIQPLGRGLEKVRSTDVPRYAEIVRHVFDRLGWDGARFRGYRCRIDYPVYGSQVVMTFDPAEE